MKVSARSRPVRRLPAVLLGFVLAVCPIHAFDPSQSVPQPDLAQPADLIRRSEFRKAIERLEELEHQEATFSTRDRAELRVRLLRLAHLGGSGARTAAIAAARAARIASLDADCVPRPGWLHAALANRDQSSVVMGRVVAGEGFRSRLTALLDFGEFLGSEPRPLTNFAFCTVTGPTRIFRQHPIPDVPAGEDRLLASDS